MLIFTEHRPVLKNEWNSCMHTDRLHVLYVWENRGNFLGRLSNLYLISLFIPENADTTLQNSAINPGFFLEQKWDGRFPLILHSLILKRIQPNHFFFSNFLSISSVRPLLIQIYYYCTIVTVFVMSLIKDFFMIQLSIMEILERKSSVW